MKSSKRKNVSKSTTVETKCNCTDAVMGTVLFTLTAVAIIGLCYCLLSGPKFENADCLLNRAGETMKVVSVNSYGDVYTLRHTTYDTWGSDFEVETDYGKESVEKPVEFVDALYVEVPCKR